MTPPLPRHLPATEVELRRTGRSPVFLVALVLAGMLVASWPHLVNAVRSGDQAYIADGDSLLYLAWSRESVHHGSWSMTDAIHRPSGPMMHSWILFVPEALLARAIGLGVNGLGIVWRALGGGLLALSLYVLIRQRIRSLPLAAGLAAFLVFDTGFLFGQVVQRNIAILVDLLWGTRSVLDGVPRVLAHLRAPTPLLAIPFLIINFACVLRARSNHSRRDVALAGITLGLLFHVYFYFATAAFPAIALACLIDREQRGLYFRILAIGSVVAAPAVLVGAWLKQTVSPDWLHRTSKFISAPPSERTSLVLPRVLVAEWLMVSLWVFRTRREMLYLWLCTGVGLALRTHQVITGVEIENFHWSYAYGVTFSVLLALLFIETIRPTRARAIIASVLLVCHIGLGFAFRTVETISTHETNTYKELSNLWQADSLTVPPRSIVAGPPELLLLLAATTEVDPVYCRLVAYSSAASDLEHDERLALNAILSGQPLEKVIEIGELVNESDRSRRKRLWVEISATLPEFITRYGVSHVIRPNDDPPHGALLDLLQPLSRGKTWTLYGVKRPL